MNAVRLLIALLFLIPLALGATTISGNQSSYNPGDLVTLTITNDNASAALTYANVSFFNSSRYNFSCGWVRYAAAFPYTADAPCILPSNLANGSWNISVYNEYNTSDNTSNAAFTLNPVNVNFNISAAIFAPGTTLTYYLNVSYLNGSGFSINTSVLNITGSGIGILNCSNISNTSLGRYNTTCIINSRASAASYVLYAFYPNFNYSTNFTATFAINISWNSPTVVLNISSFRMEAANNSYVRINITSNSNINETLYINVSGCDGTNLTCSLNVSTNQTTILAYDNTSVTLNIASLSGATAASYTLYINVSNSTNFTTSVRPSLTVIVNPFHNFSLWTNAQPGQIPAGQTKQYVFNITNTGVSANNFSFTCLPNSPNFTCSFNTTNNSVSVDASAFTNVNLSVTASNSSRVGEESLTIVNVTDYYGLVRTLAGENFNTTTTSNLGNVTVDSTPRYVHYAGETYYFNISINNTGNIDGNDIRFNISVTAYNSTWLILNGGFINVSNSSDFSNQYNISDTNGVSNFTLDINNQSSKNISVKVFMPASASCQNSTILYIYANSSQNSSRFYNSTVIIKIPCFSFSVVMNYSSSAEYLNFSILNISKEGTTVTSFSNITFNIINQTSSTIMTNSTNVTLNVVYVSNTLNASAWQSGSYLLNINVSTAPDMPYNLSYNFSFRGVFYIARWINFPMPVLASVASGQNFNVAIVSSFGNTSNATNASGSSQKPVINSFNGGNCSQIPSLSGTTFTYTCTATATTNSTYAINASIIAASCSSDFTCTFIPLYYVVNSSTIVITYSASGSSGNQQGSPPSSNTTNRTTTTTTGLKFTVPSNVTLLNTSQTIYITLNNTNTSRQNISVNISEASDYLHFNLSYVAPKNISGNSTSTINITLTPFKWARPGNYTVSITINSINTTLTVTVPQSNVTKKVYRYVEVSKNRATSMVTLIVKNRNGYSAFMNVTENISKQIAASAKNVTIISAVNYTIIEEDPVIMWMMNMSQNQERSVIYLVAGDLGNSNLFKEPNITEGRMSTGGGGTTTTTGGGDMTWLIIGIIVVVVIAAAVIAYFFFLKPRGIKLPIKYGAFVKQEKKGAGVLGVLKGIPTKIMSIFKREKKEAPVGEKKSIFSRLSFKKRAEIKEEPKKEEKKIASGKPKPTKEDLLKKLNEVYKK